ncbi:hypothetical protein ACFVXH_03220 [Kitasatospora sp. NPDC058184]|uniref:hypothetical protein n=1 Tax=Kitasatospora sp. NPDC058184 TaxID=3346370 RepID=UPI0036D78C51
MNETPDIGALVADTRSERLAIVTDVADRRLTLRPPGGPGNEEWQAMPAHVREADPAETLRAQTAEATAVIRRGLTDQAV